MTSAVRTPVCTHTGLGSSAFARRYLRNHSYFLFLRLLRCFSSPGSLPYAMNLRTDTFRWVSPFRHPRIYAYVQLPVAFRSLSRLSSALSAKASALRPYSLNLFVLVLLCSPSSYIALYDECLCLDNSRYPTRLRCFLKLALYSVFKAQHKTCFKTCRFCCLSKQTNGLEKTRTSDLTLIRRAL